MEGKMNINFKRVLIYLLLTFFAAAGFVPVWTK